jgi:DNA adenine methylase
MILKSPFPYFGGKSRAAALVWPRFGAVRNYVEPFMGSAAMLLARPEGWAGTETVNDADGLVANFWRALRADPEATAHHADWPVNENDLHARHAWLVERKDSLQARLEGDPKFYDPQAAGWWVWGMACWIGSGFCSGKGPWAVREVDGARQLVRLGSAGQGVNRKLVHLGSAGRGVNRQLVHLMRAGQRINCKRAEELIDYFGALSARLARVRVCCGDWKRVCGPTPTVVQGLTAVFLDPPYADTAKRTSNLYRIDSEQVAHEVREWCLERGDDPRIRIALCGYEGEHKLPGWSCVQGKATNGGYGSQAATKKMNHRKERIWFSPHCLSLKSADTSAESRPAARKAALVG